MNIISKIKHYKSIVFSGSYDTSTSVGRANERARRIGRSALTAMCERFFNIIAGLLTVPITLPYFGIEQFGIWMALTGFVAFLAFSDLGLSIGLQNKLTECYGNNNKIEPGYLISSTLFLICIVAMMLSAFSYYIIPVTNIYNLIPVSKENEGVLTLTTQFVIYTFSLGLFSTVIQRILESSQDGFYSNLFLAIGRVFSLLSVYLGVSQGVELPIIVALYMGAPFISMILGGSYLLFKRKWLRPSIYKIKLSTIKEIFKIGCLSVSAQLGASIMSTGPLLVLTNQFGAAAIVPFALCQRLYGLVSMLLAVALGPLWPAYGEAKVRGDLLWISSTLRKSIYISTFIVLPFLLIMLLFGQNIIRLWSQEASAVPEYELLLVCGFWMLLLAGIRVYSMYLNGLGFFKGQAVYGLMLPIFAVYLGSNFSDSISFSQSLLLMVTVGELSRLLAMKIEVSRITEVDG